VELTKNSRIAVVCRGGPENGPFSAQALCTLQQGFAKHGLRVSGIYAVSGSSPTALLGCIREEERLCDVWFNLKPKDIIGDGCRKKGRVLIKLYRYGYALSNRFLIDLLYRHADKDCLDRIFSPEAILAKVAAVDYLTTEQVVFSNKVPEHRKLFVLGVVASMGLIPWFPPVTIDGPVASNLIKKTSLDFNSVLLVDGGYRGGLLLEEAIRESVGYDLILVVDIHGLKVREIGLREGYNAASRVERAINIISNTNDLLELSLVERINEGIEIKAMLEKLFARAEITGPLADEISLLIKRMDEGRLRLGDKHAAKIEIVSNPESYHPFDFTKFTQAEVACLMRAGHNAALKTLRRIGLSTDGIPVIKP